MNPNKNEFEKLTEDPGPGPKKVLMLPDGNIVPKHWAIFKAGEEIVIRGYVFEIARIGRKDMKLIALRENKGGS